MPRVHLPAVHEERKGHLVIIKIASDGEGAWNLFAKERDDDTAPLVYTALGRCPWAIKALVHGILTDHAEPANMHSEETR